MSLLRNVALGGRWNIGVSHRRDKTVTPSCDGLYEERPGWIVFEDLSNFADRSIDAVVRIQEYVLPPDSLYDFVARDQLPSMLNEEEQQLRWNPLQFQRTARTAQLTHTYVEFEFTANGDSIGSPNRPGNHTVDLKCTPKSTGRFTAAWYSQH